MEVSLGDGWQLVVVVALRTDWAFCWKWTYQSVLRATTTTTCHPSPRLTYFAFRSSEVRRLLLDLDPYGGSDPLGRFPLFLMRTADILAIHPSVVFWWLIRLGNFPACWREANVTPIPKGPPPSSVASYRPISITSALSKVFERLVSVRLGRFREWSGVLPTTQFAYGKGLGSCDALLYMSHTLQSSLASGQRLGLYGLISAQPLIGSTIRVFCISFVLWVLGVLCWLYWTYPFEWVMSTARG